MKKKAYKKYSGFLSTYRFMSTSAHGFLLKISDGIRDIGFISVANVGISGTEKKSHRLVM